MVRLEITVYIQFLLYFIEIGNYAGNNRWDAEPKLYQQTKQIDKQKFCTESNHIKTHNCFLYKMRSINLMQFNFSCNSDF